MKVLVNFATLKKGGGQNVGLNFIESINRIGPGGFDFIYSVVRNSDIHKYLSRTVDHNRIFFMPYNPLARMIKEKLLGKRIVKKYGVELIYSYYGTGIYPRYVPQVSGIADSNLFYPELDFWQEYKGWRRWIRLVVDRYRVWGLKRVNALIFENPSQEQRCKQLFNIDNTILIRPSIAENFEKREFRLPQQAQQRSFKGLFLCGWQRNKNFMIIPELAHELKKAGVDFHFVFTVSENDSDDAKEFRKKLIHYNVEDRVSLVGTVSKSQIPSLYQQIDFVFLLSKLESFSNNIIEAWLYHRVLIVTDAEWSRSICGDAAVYVDRNAAADIRQHLLDLIASPALREEVVHRGELKLSEYPGIDERTRQELGYLKKMYPDA